jgi:hypothetical protein
LTGDGWDLKKERLVISLVDVPRRNAPSTGHGVFT